MSTESALNHDPRSKQNLQKSIYHFLYEPTMESFRRKQKTLVYKNAAILKSSNDSFIYRGEIYAANKNPKLPRVMDSLHPSLYPEMEEYLREFQEINSVEVPYVIGFVNSVLNSSDYLHDYLRIFPECIHPPIQDAIASCKCRDAVLQEDEVASLLQENSLSIELMKKRLVYNLIL